MKWYHFVPSIGLIGFGSFQFIKLMNDPFYGPIMDEISSRDFTDYEGFVCLATLFMLFIVFGCLDILANVVSSAFVDLIKKITLYCKNRKAGSSDK